MIPEFKVILNNESIGIEFDHTVPGELAIWVKETLLKQFYGYPLSPQIARQMGDWTNMAVTQLVNQGTLYQHNGIWVLKEKLIKWSQ